MKTNREVTNRSLTLRVAISIIFYLVSLGLYSIIIYSQALDYQKLLGVANSLLVLIVDLVLLSLRERHSETIDARSMFVYVSEYQVAHMLIARLVLCFLPEYWLLTWSLIYFCTQMVASVDIS